MLHTKVVDIKDKKLSIIDAEKFISSSDFGASIFFSGTVRNQNNNIISDNYKITNNEKIAIIPPIGGG